MTLQYKHGRKLGRAKSRLQKVRITESQLADDAAVHATTQDAFESDTSEFIYTASEWGLTVSVEKTKQMVTGRHLAHTDIWPVLLSAGLIGTMQDYIYLRNEKHQSANLRHISLYHKLVNYFVCMHN